MQCSCVSVYDGDYSEVIKIRKVNKARKDHKCDECRKIIKAGEGYEYMVDIFEGDIGIHKTCNDCLSIRSTFFCDGWYFECIIEELEEYINNCRGDISESCMAELTPNARNIVCEMIENTWRDLEDEK